MRKLFITLTSCLLITSAVFAQDYQVGIGVRTPFSNGLTAKYFFRSDQAAEVLLASRWGGFILRVYMNYIPIPLAGMDFMPTMAQEHITDFGAAIQITLRRAA